MKIYAMTATFGKLEHETLTFKPGLNIMKAPNEWGKSTWCAFLVNMLYGIDTRARSTGSALADKERYAPWSGAAMSGRIDLQWNGRDITIERRTKGRTVLGEFNAYETDTGIEVSELTATNCGQMLLGVERSVFVRAGFIKLSDMPVTQDDALRRRLNNLVTTGDESGAGDKLGQTLKDLKNKCRFNNTGLLPQAENEREHLRNQLQQLQQLQTQIQECKEQQVQLEEEIARLKIHQAALDYADSLENIRQVELANAALQQAQAECAALEAQCSTYPAPDRLQEQLQTLDKLQAQQQALENQVIPEVPEPPVQPTVLPGAEDAQRDYDAYCQLTQAIKKQKRTTPVTGVIIAVLFALTSALCAFVFDNTIILWIGAGALLLSILLTAVSGSAKLKKLQKTLDALYARYPGLSPDTWVSYSQSLSRQQQLYQQQLTDRQLQLDRLRSQKLQLNEEIEKLTGGESPEVCRQSWQEQLSAHNRMSDAQKAVAQAKQHAQTLGAMVKAPEPPRQPDTLTLTKSQTQEALANAGYRQHQLQLQLGRAMGQAESLGQEALLRSRLDTLNRRINRLEDTYKALELAQNALYQATTALQRRFAPRIAKRAQELLSRLTGGRYQRIAMAEDLTLSLGAENEDTLHTAQWRSDGTIDQLYFALRLAVAEELTPDAPLILDDAFVRFDDQRLKQAMEVIKEVAGEKQILLFTCQSREQTISNI